MQKILMFDSRLNVEAVSAISSSDKDIKVYEANSSYSLYDNCDLLKPDLILVNEYYANKKIINAIKNSDNLNYKLYNMSTILYNDKIIPKNNKQNNAILVVDDFDNDIKVATDIKYEGKFIKIISLSKIEQPFHYQYCGYIQNAKVLHNVINDHQTVLSNNKNIFSICNHLNASCGLFKLRGTISVDKIKFRSLTNSEFARKYIYE